MSETNDKDDKWSLRKILIRAFAYTFCVIVIIIVVHSTCLVILEANNIGEMAGELILALLFISFIITFLYIDIRNALEQNKEEGVGRKDILDDELQLLED